MLPDEELEVDICIDTSGSVSESMIRDFLGEVQGIMEQYTNFKVSVWTFDTRVYNRQEFTPQNLDELVEYDVQGGGGTDFMVNWEFMKREEIEPHRFIMMTDGYPCGSWGDENYCETVFLIHGSKDIVAPFGTTVYYEEDEHSRRAA
jgi:predicted metal-dependent peptidase